jgi:hypothetical protein
MMFASEAGAESFFGNALSAMLATPLIACHALSLLATVLLSGLPFVASLLLRTAGVLVTPLFGPRLLLRASIRALTVVLRASFGARFVATIFVLPPTVVVLTGLTPVFIFIFVFRFFVLRMIGSVGALLRKCGR